MNKSLGSIAGTGLLLSVVFFILAALLPHGQLWGGTSLAASRRGSNQWAWDGGDRLEIDLPAMVKLIPGGTPTIIVRGDQEELKDVYFKNGKLSGHDSDCYIPFICDGPHHNHTIDVELHGVSPSDIRINGVAKVELGHLDQEQLRLRISGAGEVEGEGRVSNLDLSVSGAGNVEFAKLMVETAKVNLSGAGRAAIAPSEQADINISGVGEVELATKPKNLDSHISGMGNITGPGADAAPSHDISWHEDRHHNHELSEQIRDQVREQLRSEKFKERTKEKVKQELDKALGSEGI